jgi:hypothetical protein
VRDDERAADVVRFWRSIEMFSPQEVPRLTRGEPNGHGRVFDLDPDHPAYSLAAGPAVANTGGGEQMRKLRWPTAIVRFVTVAAVALLMAGCAASFVTEDVGPCSPEYAVSHPDVGSAYVRQAGKNLPIQWGVYVAP